jgi:chitin-binding protein
MDWTYTAPHSTDGWSYYMTKPGWDQNAPLARSGLEKIATVTHDGSKALTNPDHVIDIPANRNGYHVILAVWDIADTVNAFYNVIDVNVNGTGEEVAAPNAPASLIASEETAGGVELTWIDSNSDRSDVTYTVARDGEQVGKSSGTSFTDLEIVPGEIYQYSVTASDVQGNQSAQSTIVNFTLAQNADADATAPTVPSNLHAMEVTATEVNLMWGESFDVSGTVTYNVYRDGYLRGTTQMTMWKDSSVTAGTTYQYVVKAVDSSSNESGSSNVLNASTIAPPAPASAPAPESGGNWNSFAAYQAGDIVTLNGAIYRAVQSYQGVGNPNWIKAFSLWTPVADVASEPEVTPAPVPKPFAQWSATSAYQAGDRVVSSGANFEAVQSYQGVGDPNWINALSLWKKI